jgi:hypothetical protein
MNSNIKVTLTCAVLMLIQLAGYAKTVEVATAQKLAINFYYDKTSPDVTTNIRDLVISDVYTKMAGNTPVYYVFTINGNGFIIVTADDNLFPVLGFSTESSFNYSELPPALNEWLENCSRQILRNSGKTIINPGIHKVWEYYLTINPSSLRKKDHELRVTPLVTTRWNQDDPYNELCPEAINGPGGHAYAGCVATAMAQIMRYYQYPDHGTGSHAIDDPRFLDPPHADFGNTTYNWSNMPNYITSSNLDIARLMYQCGVAVDMYYNFDGSSAFSSFVPTAMRVFFNYAVRIKYIERPDYTDKQWDSILVDNLELGKPVLYSGSDANGNNGHAWVCDGVIDSSFYHFNWGWGGYSNGYYYTDDLSPGAYDFTAIQRAVINIAPYYYQYCDSEKTYSDSSGTFGDGSEFSLYWNNTDCSWLINAPNDTDVVSLYFNSFSTEAGKDVLTVYDGPDNLSPVIGTYSGHSLPPMMTSTGQSIYIEFRTDSVNQDNGWEVTYATSVTGINNSKVSELVEVFPNPARETLTLVLNNLKRKRATVTLTSALGTSLFTEIIDGRESITTKSIDISSVKAGLYILRIYMDDIIIMKKVLIE